MLILPRSRFACHCDAIRARGLLKMVPPADCGCRSSSALRAGPGRTGPRVSVRPSASGRISAALPAFCRGACRLPTPASSTNCWPSLVIKPAPCGDRYPPATSYPNISESRVSAETSNISNIRVILWELQIFTWLIETGFCLIFFGKSGIWISWNKVSKFWKFWVHLYMLEEGSQYLLYMLNKVYSELPCTTCQVSLCPFTCAVAWTTHYSLLTFYQKIHTFCSYQFLNIKSQIFGISHLILIN